MQQLIALLLFLIANQLSAQPLETAQIQTTKSMIRVLETQYSAEGTGFETLLQLQIDLVNYDLLQLAEIVKSHIAKAKIERYLPLN